ncbi:MAG: folylpolyglutamate synthase/dihydrofolate synthase family protein, partial [Myxococcota bacterium]|nr:folylpolyglutamate synthase/dihydrofolate synthase family protein [Myxococcota bacterium]
MREHEILNAFASAGIRLGIDRFQSFIEYIGNPTQFFPVIHVAGTNGKGSVVRILESVLTQAGYRVGTYTSPHLQHINERITINTQPIDDNELDRLLRDCFEKSSVWSESELGFKDDIPLTYFELLTAVSFIYFAQQKVEVAIVEVGLGGRFDATNIVTPLVSIIASIGLDHTELLGSNESSIAMEKAGIIKQNRSVVTGYLSNEAMRTIRMIAMERSAALYSLGQEISLHDQSEDFEVVFQGETYTNLSIPLLGSHQPENAAISVAALSLIHEFFPVSQSALRAGLQNVAYPGRMEWLGEDILIDCAHNEAGAIRLADYLRKLPRDRPRTMIFGASQGKDFR